MLRRGFTLVELVVALVLLAVGVLGALGAWHHAVRAERAALESRRQRALAHDRHERRLAGVPERGGWTLVELMMALAITLLLAMSAGRMLVGPADRAATHGARARAEARRLDEAADLLAREVREGWHLAAIGDTALSMDRVVGHAIACAEGIVPIGGDNAGWRLLPRRGDDWRWWSAGRWVRVRGGEVHGATCPDGHAGWRPDTSLAWASGAPVVVTRGVRWVAYRDADRQWQLGLRERSATGWDVVQPVLGPFNGLTLHWSDSGALGVVSVGAGSGVARRETQRTVVRRNP